MELQPLLIEQKQSSPFKFWLNQKLYEGLYCCNELFCYLTSFDSMEREQAYSLGCALSRQGEQVVITCSVQQCTVWISLRIPQLPDNDVSTMEPMLNKVLAQV